MDTNSEGINPNLSNQLGFFQGGNGGGPSNSNYGISSIMAEHVNQNTERSGRSFYQLQRMDKRLSNDRFMYTCFCIIDELNIPQNDKELLLEHVVYKDGRLSSLQDSCLDAAKAWKFNELADLDSNTNLSSQDRILGYTQTYYKYQKIVVGLDRIGFEKLAFHRSPFTTQKRPVSIDSILWDDNLE